MIGCPTKFRVDFVYFVMHYLDMASKAAVLRLVPLVRGKLSGAPADRLEKTLSVIGDDGRAVLAEVLDALYPELGRDAALTAFRQFRREVSLAA